MALAHMTAVAARNAPFITFLLVDFLGRYVVSTTLTGSMFFFDLYVDLNVSESLSLGYS